MHSCNYKIYDWEPKEFALNACFICHLFLFTSEPPPRCVSNGNTTELIGSEIGNGRIGIGSDDENVDRFYRLKLDCSHLSDAECFNWQQCCDDADKCCWQQVQSQSNTLAKSVTPIFTNNFQPEVPKDSLEFCQTTWDGFSCFPDTPVGTTIFKNCPRFYNGVSGADGVKICTENGTWFSKDGLPWTDYTACVPITLHSKFIVSLSLSCLSIVAIALALFTFIYFKRLWKQMRIRIHTSLFIAILLYNLAVIPSDIIFILYNGEDAKLVKISETLPWYVCLEAMRFFKVATFSWMFCEGLYLFRLLKSGLKPPHKATMFYIIGWVSPFVVISVYTFAKLLVRDYKSSSALSDLTSKVYAEKSDDKDSCALQKTAMARKARVADMWLEYIIIVPCLLSLAANYIFLVAIVRVMTSLPVPKGNENFRRVSSASIAVTANALNKAAAERKYLEKEASK